MSEKLLTVVIPTHNHFPYTKNCVASIIFSKFSSETTFDVLFVDNASTDETLDFIDFQIKYGYPVRLIKNIKNIDYLLAANQGWKEVKTPYCLQMNNDIVLEPNCIQNMLNTFKMDPTIGIVGGIQYSPQRSIGKTLFRRGEEVTKFQDEDLRYVVPLTEEEYNKPYFEAETTGFCCAMIKKELWEKIGYYDEQFAPCMSEQEDYCLRAKEAGFKVAISLGSLYVHYIGVSTQDNRDYYQGILSINRAKFLNKWGEKLKKGLV